MNTEKADFRSIPDEGVTWTLLGTPCLTGSEVRGLLRRLPERFRTGELLSDGMAPWIGLPRTHLQPRERR